MNIECVYFFLGGEGDVGGGRKKCLKKNINQIFFIIALHTDTEGLRIHSAKG